MNPQTLNALFTVESLLSLQGAAAASFIVPNGIGYLVGSGFDRYRKWVSFAMAMFLAYLVALLTPETHWIKWILAFFNGFLIFSSAVGINEGLSSGRIQPSREARQFLVRWYGKWYR
ncbi:MAG: hypothetical protein RMK65_02870 [Anaerolineae bacterium]|nr:hypothetical protein [Anaerolineae bacterium]MCX8066612.1 hypothetical protein [Anaerolineae bacterium]MDW7991085.1 hypothetical protein [Anaerolineae bacterium]